MTGGPLMNLGARRRQQGKSNVHERKEKGKE
jgi:hypothetical protein